jgi:putative transposase
MDLQDAGAAVKYLIRDRDTKYPPGFDSILEDAGTQVVLSGVRMPRMNSLMERWVLTCRREVLDRALIWNTRRLVHILREFEIHYNSHRPHQGLNQAAPLRAVPASITDPDRINRLNIVRGDHLGGTLHEYRHAA